MIILDTNVLSEPLRPIPSAQVLKWLDRYPSQELFTTAVSESEILYGITIYPDGKRKDELRVAAQDLFRRLLQDRVLAFNSDAAHIYAEIASARRRVGRPMSRPDAQICSIALVTGAALATRNTRDFEGCGVEILNPWLV
ncbi:MAG: type II toxin-antitoxin system VapC family toxin [Acidobacteria bacterium]|nr:type II toxin-antitoxin system VapC family toxin [Acidobacteriota bacterium]MBV9147412.1 type II toxin-antitoxin system VapC family toxin [Acidobacteriota bacterium]MBV9437764.1 type II toxin-antitoxin system VapC family toxin [Acidobacteriota bacterium]